MAVPKKKTSKQKGRQRRAGNGSRKVTFPNVVVDKTTGEYKLPHHISIDGYYDGEQVITNKSSEEAEEGSK